MSYDGDLIYFSQRVEEPHMGMYDGVGVLVVFFIILFQSVFCSLYCIIAYRQPPVSFPFVFEEECQICKLVVLEIPSFRVLLDISISFAVPVLMFPLLICFVIIDMMSEYK